MPHGTCGVVSFELKGGREAAGTFMKHLKLAAIETHVADARTCCLNPASSTHRQMTDKQLAAAGIPAGLVRMSCGLESKQDLIGDIAQALDQVRRQEARKADAEDRYGKLNQAFREAAAAGITAADALT